MFDKIAPGLVMDSGMAQKQLLFKKQNLRKTGKKNAGFAAPLILQNRYSTPSQRQLQHLSPLTLPLKTSSLPTFGNCG
eukprot:UN06791